ncbi:hypothetical protein CVS40_12808 [Lucilia cuprina]|nr:hypothetical protein CVS40_12808 [Lucilia cuprina]
MSRRYMWTHPPSVVLRDKLYPDNRTMGYHSIDAYKVGSIKELTNTFSNMSMTDVGHTFNDVIVDRKKLNYSFLFNIILFL